MSVTQKLCRPSHPVRDSKPELSTQSHESAVRAGQAYTELLILSDGRILAHNLTPEMALVLKELHEPAN